MHSAVLQNKSYISFANDNTVEVVAVSRLDEGVQKNDPRAATYKAKDESGADVEYMASWPGLTLEQMRALNSGPASRYNDTGRIPQVYVVDPHTLQKMDVGEIQRTAKGIQDAVLAARKTLDKAHGKGFPRRDYSRLMGARGAALREAGGGDFGKALASFRKVHERMKDIPESLKAVVASTEEKIIGDAKASVAELEALSASDPAAAKRELIRMGSRLRGTGLEKSVDELIRSL